MQLDENLNDSYKETRTEIILNEIDYENRIDLTSRVQPQPSARRTNQRILDLDYLFPIGGPSELVFEK